MAGPDSGVLPERFRLSPSQAESYETCPRRYVLERRLGIGDGSSVYALFGSLVHEVLERAEQAALDHVTVSVNDKPIASISVSSPRPTLTNTTVTGVFIIALLFHTWIGMRDIVLDYVKNIMLRIFILAMLMGVLIGSALWALRILFLSVV